MSGSRLGPIRGNLATSLGESLAPSGGPARPVVDDAFPGALDVEADGDALTARSGEILLIENGIGGVRVFATGGNLGSIYSIYREASGSVLALEGDEIVRVFANGSQRIVPRNQFFGSASPLALALSRELP